MVGAGKGGVDQVPVNSVQRLKVPVSKSIFGGHGIGCALLFIAQAHNIMSSTNLFVVCFVDLNSFSRKETENIS